MKKALLFLQKSKLRLKKTYWYVIERKNKKTRKRKKGQQCQRKLCCREARGSGCNLHSAVSTQISLICHIMSLPLVPFLIGVGTATAATLSLATQLGIRGQMTGLHDKAEMEFNEKLFKYKKVCRIILLSLSLHIFSSSSKLYLG